MFDMFGLDLHIEMNNLKQSLSSKEIRSNCFNIFQLCLGDVFLCKRRELRTHLIRFDSFCQASGYWTIRSRVLLTSAANS